MSVAPIELQHKSVTASARLQAALSLDWMHRPSGVCCVGDMIVANVSRRMVCQD